MACGDDGGALLGFLSGPVDPVHPVSLNKHALRLCVMDVINSTLSPITDLASLYYLTLMII